MSFIYLASPYTPVGVEHPLMQARIREDRYFAACRAAAVLMRRGHRVFCPIAHSHAIDRWFGAPESGAFWQDQDEPYLLACDELVVLEMPGWTQSVGVAHEIAVAQRRGIPVTFMSVPDRVPAAGAVA